MWVYYLSPSMTDRAYKVGTWGMDCSWQLFGRTSSTCIHRREHQPCFLSERQTLVLSLSSSYSCVSLLWLSSEMHTVYYDLQTSDDQPMMNMETTPDTYPPFLTWLSVYVYGGIEREKQCLEDENSKKSCVCIYVSVRERERRRRQRRCERKWEGEWLHWSEKWVWCKKKGVAASSLWLWPLIYYIQ